MSIQVEGLTELVADLSKAPFQARLAVRGISQASAARVKADAVQAISGLAHAPAYPRSITYDIAERGVGEVAAEIGPDKSRPQGALGNLLEYGSVNNPPHAHLGPALDREGPLFAQAIMEAAGRLL